MCETSSRWDEYKSFRSWPSPDPEVELSLVDLLPFTHYNVWIRQRATESIEQDDYDDHGEQEAVWDHRSRYWSEAVHFRVRTEATGQEDGY